MTARTRKINKKNRTKHMMGTKKISLGKNGLLP